MTLLGWIFLLALAAALATATALRRRPAARISAARGAVERQLPPRDDLAGLGLSDVRPVSAARAVAPTPVPVAARPAQPAAQPAARPTSPDQTPSAAWIDRVLDDRPVADVPRSDPPGDPSSEAPAAEALGAERLDAETLDVGELDGDASTVSATPAAPQAQPADDTVWTFDAAAVPPVIPDARPAPAASPAPAYVRPGQTLWPAGSDAAAFLVASLASRLGGSVAVVYHDGAAYTPEMVAGPAAATAAAAPVMRAADHPLDRVPQDGVLSLLGDTDGHTLSYHAEPAVAVGQALARTLAPPPAARVLLVADIPPGAAEVDRDTARLVDHYAALLADLTQVPTADRRPDDETDDEADTEVPAEALAEAPAASADDAGDELSWEDDLLAGATALDLPPGEFPAVTPAERSASARAGASDTPPASDGPEPARATVAKPGSRRAAAPPPPRAVILNAEIDAARRDRRLLVFALVTLADAETVLRGGADDVVRAEAALRERLSAAPAVRRVEPFGDLLFGAFLDAEGPEVGRWAERLSASGRPLLVGAVPAVGAADAVRAAATDALQRAYETEAVCVVAG